MQIESLELRNYRLFREATFSGLPRLVVMVGANGSGKSAWFDVFRFLKDALTYDVAQAVAARGGFRELVSRGAEGPIGITVKFRESGGDLATYELVIASDRGRPVVEREVLTPHRGSTGRPRALVDFSRGRGSAITGSADQGHAGELEERKEHLLDTEAVLAIKGLGQFQEYPLAAELRRAIECWHVSDFHIGDVSQVARSLFERHPDRFARALRALAQRVPGVRNAEARTTEDGRLVLRFQDGSFQDPFVARHVSDGTLKMFAYLVLLHEPAPHPLLVIEEPENQLYPDLLSELAEEFRDYARRGGQVFVSTHSPEFLNGISLDEIYWLVKRDGFTVMRRARDSELLRNLIAEGDQPGALWRQGLFEGAGPR
jgi:predicted ATPase